MAEDTRVLMIEDEEKVASIYIRTIKRLRPNFLISHKLTLTEGIEELKRTTYDVLLLDLILPDSQGINTMQLVRTNFPSLPILVLTGIDDFILLAAALKCGVKFYLVKNLTPPQSLVQFIDAVVEQHHLELQLQQAQKLEAVGRLAAGIAHELNTPAQFVSDNLAFLKEAVQDIKGFLEACGNFLKKAQAVPSLQQDVEQLRRCMADADLDYLLEEMPKSVSQCQDGIGRVASIVRAMKEFGHPGSGQKKNVDINRCLRNTLIVARNEYKYVAEAVEEYGDVPPVLGYESELNQVFLNLIVNAAHAIGEVQKQTGQKGKITVRTRQENDQVLVEIADTGCGIPENIRDKIFEPFFTTKEVGKGTGQGLALARNVVVDKHAGRIDFTSTVGQGTTFFIRLPTMANKP